MPAKTRQEKLISQAVARARAGQLDAPELLQSFPSRREAWAAAPAYAAAVRRLAVQRIVGVNVRRLSPDGQGQITWGAAGVYVERQDQ